MQTSPNSPGGTRSESIAAFPPHDSGQAPDALTKAHSTFDPADWLAAFEAVGGCWVVHDKLWLMFRVEDRPDEAMIAARLMVNGLSPEQRAAVHAHLREGEAL